jgi:hypothetical protein
VQPLGRAGEVALVGHRDEVTQPSQVDHAAMLTRGDGALTRTLAGRAGPEFKRAKSARVAPT